MSHRSHKYARNKNVKLFKKTPATPTYLPYIKSSFWGEHGEISLDNLEVSVKVLLFLLR